jgi:hypothetical protein
MVECWLLKLVFQVCACLHVGALACLAIQLVHVLAYMVESWLVAQV